MRKITPQFLPYVERAPRFVQSVEKVKREGEGIVRETLESFQDDPFLLYACLWYAYSKDVPVLFEAPIGRSKG